MVVTANPFERDEEPILLEAKNPELETSEDIDPSLEVVSRPRAADEAQQRCMFVGRPHSLDSKFSSGNRSLRV
jgi:hypothetical protein